MRSRKSLHLLFVVMLIVGLLPLTAAAQPAAQRAPDSMELVGAMAPVEPMLPAGPAPQSLPQAVLWDNGPLVTHPGGGYNGADASALQSALGMNTYGFGNQFPLGYRMADDFAITGPGWWQIDQVTFFAYQTATYAYPPPSTITGVYYQIWNGPPDDPGSSVVFGDLATNRLTGTYWPGIYRVPDTNPGNTQRPAMANVASAGVYLPPGTYWLDWMTAGSGQSGPWAPPVTTLGQTTTGDAMQYTSAWAPALDSGTGTQQGIPFIIEGTVMGGDDPEIVVTPGSLYAEQLPGEVTSQTLQICNAGGADLTWSLSEGPHPTSRG
jgi:hypothetical protein